MLLCWEGDFLSLVSKAGSKPVATVSKVEADAAPAAGKMLILSQEYWSGMPPPQLRKEVIGLFGYEILKTSKGFRIFAQDAIDKSEIIISSIKEMTPSMDDISDTGVRRRIPSRVDESK